MFMQAGFAIVETGLCRAKNANHTMMMNFMVYGVGMLAYWLIGFAIQMGGVGAVANLGGTPPLNSEYTITCSARTFGLFGQNGLSPDARRHLRRRRHGGVPVPDGLHGHGADDRHRLGRRALEVRGVPGLVVRAWARSPIRCSPTGPGAAAGSPRSAPTSAWARATADFAGSGVVHSVGGITALAHGASSSGRASASTLATAKPNAIPGHDIVIVLTGCFILAFGWFGFNPGSTLGASGNGNLRIGSVAVNTMLAGMAGSFGAMFYMWMRYGKPDASMSRQRPAGRPGRDHRALRLRQPGRARSSSA